MPKPYPEEFRRDVVAVARKGEIPLTHIAKDFGIGLTALLRFIDVFPLCPYPPLGQQSYHAEMPEGFCRKLQQDGHSPHHARSLPDREFATFWERVSQRVRPRIGRPGAQF